MENNEKKTVKTKSSNVVWTVALSVLSGLILGLSFLLYSAYSTSNNYAVSLETNYQKSFYDLNDKINNMEIKLSKVISSQDDNYSAKMLAEISKNAQDAQSNLNLLPVSLNGVEESLTFINQVDGFTSTLYKKISKGETLSNDDMLTLEKLHSSVQEMKTSMGDMMQNIWKGYSILDGSLSLKGDYNEFTVNLQSMKATDVDYPTMIYDGPFSDSQIKKEVKGLNEPDVNQNEAKANLSKLMNIKENEITFETEAKSNFDTYDFSFSKNDISYYAQVTVKGGKLLTLSSYNDSNQNSTSVDKARNDATEFVFSSGIQSVECVWSDIVGQDAYFNFAPVINDVVIYPDLVKVKVDLASGQITGYEANSYYINHKNRNLTAFGVSLSEARGQVKENYVIKQERKVLAPIDYEEILCWEFNTLKNGEIYYFYVDGETGQLVNVLKVIKTSDGSKLM